MKTAEFESVFLSELRDYLTVHHQGLTIDAPFHVASGIAPGFIDVVIRDRTSNKILGIEIKTGTTSLPVGVFPSLRKTHEIFTQQLHGEMVVLSNIPPSGALQSNISASHLPFVYAPSPEEAVRQLEPHLVALETPVFQ